MSRFLFFQLLNRNTLWIQYFGLASNRVYVQLCCICRCEKKITAYFRASLCPYGCLESRTIGEVAGTSARIQFQNTTHVWATADNRETPFWRSCPVNCRHLETRKSRTWWNNWAGQHNIFNKTTERQGYRVHSEGNENHMSAMVLKC